MALSRRDFLKLGVLATAGATACGQEWSNLPVFLPTPAGRPTTAPRPTPTLTPLPPPSRELKLLNRAGYGPRPGDLARAQQMGFEAYLEAQLNPESLDDSALEGALGDLPVYSRPLAELVAMRDNRRAEMLRDLSIVTLGSALFSQRQLYAAMVEFWSDHFHIFIHKAPALLPLKIVDDRETIRPNALGKFRDLLTASVHSPAMLVYLDNAANRRGAPNENYARELLELHTLGVNGGYTQNDVSEAARILTGWTIPRRGAEGGPVRLSPDLHDKAAKSVLGQSFPADQGEQDIQQLINLLAGHPATAQHLATKLVRRFVADEPPADLVSSVAQTFLATDGDIKAMLRVIFLSPTFAQAPPKLKRPYTFLASALRALAVRPGPESAIGEWLQQLGQPLFAWPAPDGYPDVGAAWMNYLLPRWSLALTLCDGTTPGLAVPWTTLERAVEATHTAPLLDAYAQLLLHRPLDAGTLALFQDYVGSERVDSAESQSRLRQCVALLLAGPAFQWM